MDKGPPASSQEGLKPLLPAAQGRVAGNYAGDSVLLQDEARMLLRFGAVHTCRVVPVPNAEVLQRMDAGRIADQEKARRAARAIVGHHVRSGHILIIQALLASFALQSLMFPQSHIFPCCKLCA